MPSWRPSATGLKSGVPAQPGAWLRVTARRKAVDRLRREARHRVQLLSSFAGAAEVPAPEPEPGVVDDRLLLIFMCCHPALARASQVALTLRSLLGLTTAQLARAFLTSEATLTKRIVRAKRTIMETKIPFALPAGAEVQGRLGAILAVVYMLFNEGYLSAGPAHSQRAELADDAEWLAGLLVRLLPDEPEVIGLLALIRLHQARRSTRFDAAGDLVLLRDQDRSLWDCSGIDDALALLNGALRRGQPGYYQAQAAIAACHATAQCWECTDWRLIADLYDQLLAISDSPIVALNRAIALRYRDGPQAALAALEPLAARLDSYCLFHATRAEVLRALGRTGEAADEDRVASRLTTNPAELNLLYRRLADATMLALDGSDLGV